MPRKKSVSGRAKRSTEESKLLLQAQKITKRFRSLEKGRNFGVYTGKTLLEFASRNPFVEIKKSRRSKRHRLFLRKIKEASEGNLAKIAKTFTSALSSKTFTNKGIKEVREETRKKVTKTLEGIAGKDLTDRDVDLFYEIIKYKSNEILQKIKPSDFYALVLECRENNYGPEKWVSMLSDYVTINNDVMREAAKYLYNKFVVI